MLMNINNNKRIQSIKSIETYARKQIKNKQKIWDKSISLMLQNKIWNTIIQNGHEFLIIHTEY